MRYQRGYLNAAEDALKSINGTLAEPLQSERFNLLAQIYMDEERFGEAVQVLNDWEGSPVWSAYAKYNLGVALVRLGQLEAGAALLDQVGTIPLNEADRDELLGLRDRANLALGFAYLQADLKGDAKPILQRVRLNGPFSNKALLGFGWAEAAGDDYRRALVPWLELNGGDRLDNAVQESLLAVPYAYSQLGAQPLAAQYYARALDIYSQEIKRINDAVASARDGRLINTLLANDDITLGGWYWQLDDIPQDEKTRYLYFSIAGHEFHEGLKSYRNLIVMNRFLEEWREKLSAYRDMLDTRILAYSERMPVLQQRIDEFDIDGMQESYELLAAHSVDAQQNHDVVAFASAAEQSAVGEADRD